MTVTVGGSDVDYDPNGGIATALLGLLNASQRAFKEMPRNVT